MDRRLIVLGPLMAVLAQGCSGGASIEYPHWATSDSPTPEANSGYAAYCRAADLAEKAIGDLGETVTFTPGKRKELLSRLGPALSEIGNGVRAGTLGYCPVTTPLGEVPRYHRGFRLLGLGLLFKVQDAVEREDYASAISAARSATRFGFDLCNGGAMDASLGMSIANDARGALASCLPRLTAKQLQEVSESFRTLLERRPSMLTCLDNERDQMLGQVQSLQDSFLSGDADKSVLQLNLPSAARRAFESLKGKSGSERIAFFKGFADEVDAKSRYWRELVALPLSLRSPNEKRIQKLKLPDDRPWRVFSDHFCSLGEPLIEMNDECLARTRLLVIEAGILSKTKSGQNAPRSINAFNDTAIDPYTGRLFAYHADGKEFRVYSTGPNLIDDGGEVGESGAGLDVFMN